MKLTRQQQKALHVGFGLLADALNEAGYTVQELITMDIDWTPYAVKEYLWRPFQKAMTGKKSTTELDKQMEIDKIWDTLMRELGEKKGIEYISFPHIEEGQKDKDGKIKISNY